MDTNLIFNYLKDAIFHLSTQLQRGFYYKLFPNLDQFHNVIALILLLLLSCSLLVYLLNKKVKYKEIVIPSIPALRRFQQPRFRKRDKIRYFVSRYSRRLHEFTESISQIKSKNEKKRLMSNFARRLLGVKDDEPKPMLRRLPAAFFEPETDDEDASDLPDELKLCLSSVKVFGQLEKTHYLQFFRYIECLSLTAGQYLFQPGEEDSSMYIVRSGKVKVFYRDENGAEYPLNEVIKGGNIHSLLSVLDVLTGRPQPYKTVFARAVTPAEVLRLPVLAFLNIFEKSPFTLIRMVQIIGVRLGRVTFLALNTYLGLSTELLSRTSPVSQADHLNKVHEDLNLNERYHHLYPDGSKTEADPLNFPHDSKRPSEVHLTKSAKTMVPPSVKTKVFLYDSDIPITTEKKTKSSKQQSDDDDIAHLPTLSASWSGRQSSLPIEHTDNAVCPRPHRQKLSRGKRLPPFNRVQSGYDRVGCSSCREINKLHFHRSRSQSPSGLLSRQISTGDNPYDVSENGEYADEITPGDEDSRILFRRRQSLGQCQAHFFKWRNSRPRQHSLDHLVIGKSAMGSRENISQLSHSNDDPTLIADPELLPEAEAAGGDTFTNSTSKLTPPSAKFTIFRHRLSRVESPMSPEVLMYAKKLLGLNEEEMQKLLEAAYKDIAVILGLQDPTLIEGKLSLSVVAGNTTLVKQGEEDGGLFLVVMGKVQCLLQRTGGDSTHSTCLYVGNTGELLGSLSTVSREPSLFTYRTLAPAAVIVIEPELFYHLVHCQASVALNVANCFVRRLSPMLRQIDFALEWYSIKAGHSLYKQGDVAHSVYIVLNGRLRQIYEAPNGTKELVEEIGRGELVGFLEALSNQARVTTVLAVRDTEVARIPIDLLDMIKRKAPQVVGRLIQLLSNRLLGSITGSLRGATAVLASGSPYPTNLSQSGSLPGQTGNLISNSLYPGGQHNAAFRSQTGGGRPDGTLANLRTVAVLSTSSSVPLESFILELQHAMNTIGESLRLTSNIILRRLGQRALDSANEYKLLSWLSKQEDNHRIVFYVCDSHANTVWTRRCIRQADCVLVVAPAKADPAVITSMEAAVTKDSIKVNRMLILTYPDDVDYPPAGRTSQWLQRRPWIKQHFHIRCPSRMFSSARLSYEKLIRFYRRVHEVEKPSPHSDLSRLARYLTGTSVGLVLGGGGARGCAHVGIIRGLQEAGIPIDVIGGTSIGSFMGALWAEETRLVRYTQRAREFCRDMSSIWNKVLDITYPVVSFLTGKSFNTSLENMFKKRQVEDLWIPYFCVTTDITNSAMRVHTQGSLWRYVRASMTLSGYLPPLCDPYDGSLLLDGGYVNNVPADIMYGMGLSTIFAVDVGSHDDRNHTNFGDSLSGWQLLYSRYFRRSNPMRVPNMAEIQSRLAYVSCVRQLEIVKQSGICEYIRPKIERYQTLQFASFEEIQEVGFQCIQEKLDEWRKRGVLSYYQRFGDSAGLNTTNSSGLPHSSMGATPRVVVKGRKGHVDNLILGAKSAMEEQRQFIDLTELVSHIVKPDEEVVASSSDEDYIYYNDNTVSLAEKSAPRTTLFADKIKKKKRVKLPKDKNDRRSLSSLDDNGSTVQSCGTNDDTAGSGYLEEDEGDEDIADEHPPCSKDIVDVGLSQYHPNAKAKQRHNARRKHYQHTMADIDSSQSRLVISRRRQQSKKRAGSNSSASLSPNTSSSMKTSFSKSNVPARMMSLTEPSEKDLDDFEEEEDDDVGDQPLGITASDSELLEPSTNNATPGHGSSMHFHGLSRLRIRESGQTPTRRRIISQCEQKSLIEMLASAHTGEDDDSTNRLNTNSPADRLVRRHSFSNTLDKLMMTSDDD